LAQKADCQDITGGLGLLAEYVGAVGFLLARHELSNENVLDNIVSSNWPFDMVRKSGVDIISSMSRSTELDKCLSVLTPTFSMLPEDTILPYGASRQFCSVIFSAGRSRYCLMLLCPADMILSQQRLRETALLTSYFASLLFNDSVRSTRELELTERELECLYWIAEGKTSDEIATIIGISKNTINNYITSVMRKTATRTRSEAIAYAVRNNLV
jgi:DNA-binding CsgD family transcriptional regulator